MAHHERSDVSREFRLGLTAVVGPPVTSVKLVRLVLSRENWPLDAIVTVTIERVGPIIKGKWNSVTAVFRGDHTIDSETGLPRPLEETFSVQTMRSEIPGSVRVQIDTNQPVMSAIQWKIDDGLGAR